jgi:hypothetical protein
VRDRDHQDTIRGKFEIDKQVREPAEPTDAGAVEMRRISRWVGPDSDDCRVEFGDELCREILTDASVPSTCRAGFLDRERMELNFRHRRPPEFATGHLPT